MAEMLVTNTMDVPRVCGSVVLLPGVPTKVPMSFFSSFSGIPTLTFDFSEMPQILSSQNEKGQTTLDWYSPLSGVDGYGRHATWYLKGLINRGIDVNVHDSQLVDSTFLDEEIRRLLLKGNRSLPCKVGIAYTLGYDPIINNHSSLVKIAITQFETDHLPERHVGNLNLCDHVIATTSFGVKVFRDSGVTIPVSSMRPAIDISQFPYVERPRDGLFKVLMLGALTPRKNPLAGIRIFQAASKGDPNWRLTIKTRYTPWNAPVKKSAAADRRITFIDKQEGDILHYYNTHDVLLWPSKGEGVGLPPMEAMSTGMDVVASLHSGMLDFISSKHAWPIKVSHMESAHQEGDFNDNYIRINGNVGNWWVPDENHAAKQLAACYTAVMKGKGKGGLAADYIRDNHRIDQAVDDILRVVEDYL